MSIDYAAYIRDVGMLEAVDVHSASHWRKQVHARNVGNLSELGDKLPWSKTHGKFQLREGEVTVWAGYDGARKSMILGQIMAHISFAKKVAIASLEMRPEATLLRMCRQIAGHKPTTSIINKFLDHGENNILIYDQLDMVEEDKLLGFIHYSASKLNCKHIVIDSLTKLAFPDNDRTAEIRFKARAQEKLNEGKPLDQKELDSLSKPDQFLIVDKQREGEWEGIFALWFELSSTQFLGQEGHKKFRYEKITN